MDNTAQPSNPVSTPDATATTPAVPPSEPTALTPSPVPADPPATPTPADPPAAPVEPKPTDPPTPTPADPPAQPPADSPAPTPAPEEPKAEPVPAPVAPPTTEAPAPATTPPATPTPADPPAAPVEPKPEETPAPMPTPSPATPPAAPAGTSDTKPAETPAPSLAANQTPPPPMQPKGKHWHVSPWTLILILVLLGFSGFFLYVAISPKLKPAPVIHQTPTPTPTPVAQSVLSLQPAPTSTPPAQLGTQVYDVMIDTHVNTVNAVQLELSYDPTVLTNVAVTPGTFFTTPQQLVKDIDIQNGRISYALGIEPKDKGVQGTGVVAQISFQFLPTATASSTMLSFLPKTLVAAQGVNPSVLKSTTDATIVVPHQQDTKTQLQPTTVPLSH